jgi:PAS domain S-box-containing protein
MPSRQVLPETAQNAPAKLESEQAPLARLFEILPYPASYIDTALVYRQCNSAAAATVGRTRDQVVGESVASVVGAESEVLDLLRGVLSTGEPYSGTVEFDAPGSSSTAFFQVSYLPDIDAEGKVIGVLTNVVDITDLVRGERALRASEERLRRIARAGRIGFVEYNVAADEAYWSPEHYELFGFEDGSQVDWQRWLEGVHPEDRERIEANAALLLERAASEGQVRGHTDEYRFVRPDGTVAWIEADMAADMVDGQPIVRGIVRDVTEHKRMEGALRESEEQNAFLLLLTDALRPLDDPIAVQETASRVLGEHLQADRVGYFEIDGDDCVIQRDWAPSLPHLSMRFRVADFERLMSVYRSGRMVVMNDVAEERLAPEDHEAYSEVQVAAQISVPLIKAGRFVGGLSVHSAAPRAWTPLEMRLLEETAERTWAAVERAKAESELSEGEERYRQLFESESDALLLIDQETGRIIEVNAAAEAMYGYDPEELLGLTDLELSAEPESTREASRRAAAGENILVPMRRHRRKDGSEFFVEITGRIFNLRGRPVRIAAVRDVSERIRSEEALRESNARFRSLFETMEEAFFLYDPVSDAAGHIIDVRYADCNPAAERFVRKTRAELIGRTSTEALGGSPTTSSMDALRSVVATGEPIQLTEFSVRLGRWYTTSMFSPWPGQIAMILLDITQSKQAEEALGESEERFRSLFESSPDAVFLTVPDGTILAANPAACSLFGWSEEEFLGEGRFSMFDESDPRFLAALEERQRTGQVRGVELAAIRANGERFPAEVESVIVAGEPERSFVVLRDITERKRLEEEKNLLLEAASALSQSILLPDVLDQLARITLEVGGHSRVVISLWQEELGCLTVARSRGEAALTDGTRVALADLSAQARSAIEKNETRLIDYDALEPGRRGLADKITSHIALDVPLLFGGRFIGLLATDDPGERREFGARQIRLIEGIAAHAAVAIENAKLYEAQTSAQVERAAQEERTRLARDLHDSVTQSLFAATLKAEALTIASGDEAPGITATAEDVQRLSRGALAQMRILLLELRGDPIEEVPLHQLLRNLAEAAESRASVRVILTMDEESPLPPKVHEAAYRITQEALNNVVRHAKAQNAWVKLDCADSHARLVIGDDGCGFDPTSVYPGHFGLRTMGERVGDSGGQLGVRSVSGEGTVVEAEWRFDESGYLET